MIPTLFGILVINFVVIQALPGGPVQRVISELSGRGVGATARSPAAATRRWAAAAASRRAARASRYRGAQGLDPAFIADLERQFGFDKPAWQRFVLMLGNYLRFDFGDSFFRDRSVVDLVVDKMPVSISLGLWTTLLTYLISIPLGIRKAVRDGTPFDVWTSGVDRRRLRDPLVPVRRAADRPVRRRQLLADLPLARPGLGELLVAALVREGPGLSLAHGPADRRPC